MLQLTRLVLNNQLAGSCVYIVQTRAEWSTQLYASWMHCALLFTPNTPQSLQGHGLQLTTADTYCHVLLPSFYFLSNEELLDILSQTRNPLAVQPHLQKCFEGISTLDLGPNPKSTELFALRSAEGERIALAKTVKARGLVEHWLSSVEGGMRSTLRGLAKRGVREYAAADRRAWVLEQAAQLVVVVSNIHWCQVGGGGWMVCWQPMLMLAHAHAHGAVAVLLLIVHVMHLLRVVFVSVLLDKKASFYASAGLTETRHKDLST